MAYPTGMLSLVLSHIDQHLVGLKLMVQQVRAEAAAGSIPSSRILTLFIDLRQARVTTALDAVTDWISANFPKDGHAADATR
jgi:hypothetical protein